MRIALTICVRMMYAVRDYPLDWSTFQSHRAASHQEVFDEFRDLVTAMSQQPVVAHADTKTAANPVKDNCGDDRGPAPEKGCCDCSEMGDHEKYPSTPITFGPIGLEPLVHACSVAMFFYVHLTITGY
jgi:hypothetical protein